MQIFAHCYHIFVIFSLHIWIIFAAEIGNNKCIEDGGECIKLSKCQIYKDFLRVKLSEIEYCLKRESIVCCNKPMPAPATTAPLAYMSSSEKACQEYSNKAPKKCAMSLIVNGIKAEPKEFPHMALLGHRDSDGTIKWQCGGTLISSKYVLTAAHCFSEIINYVRLGELDWNSTVDNAKIQDFSILYDPIFHPSGTGDTKYNDIALIELNATANFDEYVFPACLSPTNGTEFIKFLAAGWGANTSTGQYIRTHLNKVILEYFSDEECTKIVPSYAFDNLPDGVKSRTQMCAGSRDSSSDTCVGDSGGPLFVNHPYYNCMFMIVGITSFGNAVCGISGTPAVYTRVNLYSEWIETIVWNNKV